MADGTLHSRRCGGKFLGDLRIERFGEGISTHSFRKWYATEIYKNNGYDITLVQRLLQHSSSAITQRYIGIEPERIEKAIEGHTQLI
ncbi:MAG: tyrosine-type recombinase/integrase [Eubacteriales bacterium]|nr:tyrosine-type recombinase/integrase [Eubacteriales bacterium]